MDGQFPCNACKKRFFSSIQGLEQHKTRYCVALRKILCPHCSNPFNSKRSLANHLRHACSGLSLLPHSNPNSDDNDNLAIADYMCETSDVHIENPSVADAESMSEYHFDLNEYTKYQYAFFDKTFSVASLAASTKQDFESVVKAAYTTNADQVMTRMRLYSFSIKYNLSQNAMGELLSIYQGSKPEVNAPRCGKTLDRFADKATADFNDTILQSELPLPKEWEMETWIQANHGPRPESIRLRVRHPIKCIAHQLINPELMLGYGEEHRHFRPYIQTNRTGERLYSDLMSSVWAEKTAEELLGPDEILLPLILYDDGVNLNKVGTSSCNPVQGTLGIFSDEIMRKPCAKMCFGYIPSAKECFNEDLVMAHLMSRGHARKQSLDMIQLFKFNIRNAFWDLLLTPLREVSKEGVVVFVLGKGFTKARIVIPFHVADGPAHASIALCFPTCPCIYCTYNPRSGAYDTERDHPRDVQKMMKLAAVAANYEEERVNNRLLSNKRKLTMNPEDRKAGARAKKRLRRLSMYPVENPFHYAPMGTRFNNIYRGTPIDLFHVFCAGLMKAAVSWTVNIISTIASASKQSNKYRQSASLFDARLAAFPVIPAAPHLPKSAFKEGLLFKLMRNATAADKSIASSAGGGYRSSHWITAMFQMIFVIGSNGDVLPDTKHFMFNGEDLGNVQAKVLDCFYCMLICYFECKRSSFTKAEAVQVEAYCTVLYARFSILWDLKQAVRGMPLNKRVSSMRKPHQLFHIRATIEWFGALSKCNTDTFETTNSTFGVKANESTSGRKDTLLEELSKHVAMRDLVEAFETIAGIVKKKKSLGPPIGNEQVLYSALKNGTHCNFRIIDVTLSAELPLCSLEFIRSPKHGINRVLCHASLSSKMHLERLISKHLISMAIPPQSWYNLKIRLLSGICFEGNVESKMGKGAIYATDSFGLKNSTKKPRYDFVTIETEVGDEGDLIQRIRCHAQVVAILEIREEDGTLNHAVIVQYLVPIAPPAPKKKQKQPAGAMEMDRVEYFPKYKWELLSYSGTKAIFNVDIVDTACLVGPAIVIPVFSSPRNLMSATSKIASSVSSGKPKLTDSFYYVRPDWIDRGGYIDDEGFEQPERRLGKKLSEGGPSVVLDYIRAHAVPERRLAFDMEDITADDLAQGGEDDEEEEEEEDDDEEDVEDDHDDGRDDDDDEMNEFNY